MTIIVTGGAGFIGSNFIFHMLSAHPDYRIVCLDKLTYAGNLSTLQPVMEDPRFRFVKLDICDREGVYALFEAERPDIVVNFAAESHVDRSIDNPSIFLETNVIGTSVLMDACRKYGIRRHHQVSTDEVYGDLPLDRPDLFFTESTPIHTSSPYSASKAGILGMTRTLAFEWARSGVTVNAVSPTVVLTELGRAAWDNPAGEAHREDIPAGRFAEPAEIAAAVAYLATEEAAMVNGTDLRVDGGFTIR